jgi:hypothetical protein
MYPETSNRTLEDIDEYFDDDSGHKLIIPFGDKATKSTARPAEALEAEMRRVAVAEGKKDILKGSAAEHVEDLEQE